MQKAEKMLKFAARTQQDLPGQPEAAAAASATIVSAGLSAGPTTATTAPSSPVAAAQPEAHLQAIERTHDLVSLHALRLRESNAENLRVVIEPGGGITLSLELRWHNDSVEAQATLNRGDFDQLSQHWAELQQRLEPRGIHLSGLENAPQLSGNSSQYHQPEHRPGPEEAAPGAFAEFAFRGSMTETPNARTSRAPHRGWETWA